MSTALKLETALAALPMGYHGIARHVQINPGQLWRLAKRGVWPKQPPRDELQQRLERLLTEHGCAAADVEVLWEPTAVSPQSEVSPTLEREEDLIMLLRKQRLLPDTQKHFSLFRDPFSNDIHEIEDVYFDKDMRSVRQAMRMTIKFNSFLAVVGGSGSGKTTLRRELLEDLRKSDPHTIVIQPYVLGMEDNDVTGKTLKAGHIAESILAAVSPQQKPAASSEARFRQIHNVLINSSRAGFKHALIIEEAHSLPIPTLKHLKRLHELEDGIRKLISIILIGQPELNEKLSPRDPNVREVVRRCESIALPPLADVSDYLAFKLQRVGSTVDRVIDAQGIQAIQEKLLINGRDGKPNVSLLYPLDVGNLMTACMNLAAEYNVARVTADIVREV